MTKKLPFVTKEQLDAIAAIYPTPFHLYDEAGIRNNARRVREAFAWEPGYREYFAVKACPNPYILKLLAECGCGADCSSYTELLLAKACGLSGSEIMFSSNATPAKDYLLAAELGAVINLDDITHIGFLDDLPGWSWPDTICCRYNPGGVFQLGNGIMDHPGEAKYGMTGPQIMDAFCMLKERGVKHFGLHAFLASNTVTTEYYPVLSETLFKLAVCVRDETGIETKFINLSGGVGIPYRPDQEANDIHVIGKGVRDAYERILVPAGLTPSLCTEMGRFMTGPYGCLVTRVIHEKHTHKDYLGCDACACDLMRPAMYGAYHHITAAGKEEEPCDHMYDVTGSLCENNDKFAIDRMLPRILPGDLLVIHDTGAHGYSMGYNYNGKLRSAELLLRPDGSVRLIRRAQTPEDLFSTFDVLDVYEDLQAVLKEQ